MICPQLFGRTYFSLLLNGPLMRCYGLLNNNSFQSAWEEWRRLIPRHRWGVWRWQLHQTRLSLGKTNIVNSCTSAPGCWEEEFVTDCSSRYFIADCDQKIRGKDFVFLGWPLRPDPKIITEANMMGPSSLLFRNTGYPRKQQRITIVKIFDTQSFIPFFSCKLQIFCHPNKAPCL